MQTLPTSRLPDYGGFTVCSVALWQRAAAVSLSFGIVWTRGSISPSDPGQGMAAAAYRVEPGRRVQRV